MKVSELDYAEQFHVFNFLKRLAEMVNGDIRKKVKIRKVWMENDRRWYKFSYNRDSV